MNTKLVSLLTYCLSVVSLSFPQSYFYNESYYDSDLLFEISLSVGAINCLTDLGGRKGVGRGFIKDLNIENTKLTAGLGAGFVYRYAAGIRIDANTGTLYANDNVLDNDHSEAKHRYKRNLHFRSSVFEIVSVAELYPLQLFFPITPDTRAPRLAPYVAAGIGVFRFNPQANLNGIWIDLHPLRTEGQGFPEHPERKPYSLTQINFPVGAGIKYELSALFNLKLEILHRITTTDYIDDVSTTYIHPDLFRNYLSPENARLAESLYDRRRELDPQQAHTPGAIRGGRRKNDAYFSIVLKLNFIIGRERR
ncbi:MAG: hypothetical protein KIT80_22030 [Chitinophagaceae bacterium]|nr:hypothetical protein [Chitinophagaceae bacterium]MCW5929615.1 hypothetical protein [Chitinophagaceae bacterium]